MIIFRPANISEIYFPTVSQQKLISRYRTILHGGVDYSLRQQGCASRVVPAELRLCSTRSVSLALLAQADLSH